SEPQRFFSACVLKLGGHSYEKPNTKNQTPNNFQTPNTKGCQSELGVVTMPPSQFGTPQLEAWFLKVYLVFAFWCLVFRLSMATRAKAKQRVAIVFTGGTISMGFDPVAGGPVPMLSGAEIIARVPGLDECALVGSIDFARLPGPHMTPARMLE